MTNLYLVDIAIIRSNSIIYDTPIVKIVRSFNKRYSVLALGWDRTGIYNLDKFQKELKWKPGYVSRTEVRMLRVRAPFNQNSLISYLPMVIYFPLFWIWVFIHLCKFKPKIVHAFDLDTILPCYLYKILFRKKLIFDVRDRYAMSLVPTKFKTLYSVVNAFEEFFSSRADVLINVSKEVLYTFRKRPNQCLIIMNCPEDYYIDKQKSRDDNVLTIVYTGAIWEKVRGLENIVAAIKDLTNVELVLAGWYRDKDKPLLDQILRIHNVKFEGLLQPKDALVLEASADVMIALYEPELLWNNITLPNKLFEAMMCGIPLITNVASKVVSEVGFGIVVKYHDVQEIRQAILTLRDDVGLRKKLGSNGRKAYLEKYSWGKMEEELLRIYDSLEQ